MGDLSVIRLEGWKAGAVSVSGGDAGSYYGATFQETVLGLCNLKLAPIPLRRSEATLARCKAITVSGRLSETKPCQLR